MPSILTLQGVSSQLLAPAPTDDKTTLKIVVGLLGLGALIGVSLFTYTARKTNLRGGSGEAMLKTIARESKSPEEYARRADAWNASEREPISQAKLVNTYMRTDPRGKTRMSAKIRRLLREAEESRRVGRERLWSRMSKGLRGVSVTAQQQKAFKRGVDAMKRAMKGTSNVDAAYTLAARREKSADFQAGARVAWNLVSPQGDRASADRELIKYGFKQG